MSNNYQENPEKEDFPAVERMFDRYKNIGVFMPSKQREMYEAIAKDIAVWDKLSLKKKVVDVGCGVGIGSNILSQEALFVWGIDKSEKNVDAAKQLFARRKLPQVSFDVVDLITFPRETMKFDVVVMVEVLEHIKDSNEALKLLKLRFGKEDTIYYISSPNRNNPELGQDKPKNEFHCREFTAAEFYDILIKHFKSVMLYKWDMSKDVDLDTQETPLLAKCVGVL